MIVIFNKNSQPLTRLAITFIFMLSLSPKTVDKSVSNSFAPRIFAHKNAFFVLMPKKQAHRNNLLFFMYLIMAKA